MATIKSFPNNQDTYIGAEDVMKWLHGRTSGVFASGGNAKVSALANSTMAVTVSDGNGWMSNAKADGIVWWNDNEAVNGSKLQLAIDPADGALNRIDRIIVEWKTTNYVDYPEIKVLKGNPASVASAPALTNNNNVRQISLARINVAAGTTAITASMITDERMDASVCGLVTDSISIDTSAMQSQFDALLKAIQNELADLEAGSGVELKKLQFSNKSVTAESFVDTATYEDYPYRASVALDGVISSMIPEVVFSLADATSGIFAPVAESYNGGVYLYASEIPEGDIIIPVIMMWRGSV
jgi:hypothetical protein